MKQKPKLKRYFALIAVVPFAIIAIMYLIIPLINLVIQGFVSPDSGGFTLQNYQTIFSKPIYIASILNSLKLSFSSTIIGLVIAFITAMAISNVSSRLSSPMMAILSMTSNFAGLPLAFAFIIILGNSGMLIMLLQAMNIPFLEHFNLYSFQGFLLLFVYFQIPLGTLLLVPSFTGIKQEWKEAAKLLHANEFQFWGRIGIPMLLPGILGTFGMLFANALTAYATIYMLMTTNYALLTIKITTLFVGDANLQPELGSALSVVMIAILLIVIGLGNIISKHCYRGGEK